MVLNADQLVLFEFLEKKLIDFVCFEHSPVFRVGEPLEQNGEAVVIPGAHTKNLFLQDQKSKRLYLVSVQEEARVDLKALATLIGASRFSFAKAEDMKRCLHLEPGSVTPLGLFFDTAHEVTFVLDQKLAGAEFVCFHPLQNNATLQISGVLFKKFITALGRNVIEVDIPCL